LDINGIDAKDGASTPLILLFMYNHSGNFDHCVEIILLMLLCAKSENDKIVEMAQLFIANVIYVIKQVNKQGRNAKDIT